MWRDAGDVSVSREPLAGSADLGVAPGFEPLELLGDGPLDDRGEVAVGDFRAHQGGEPLELVAELGAGGELHLVAGGRQRLDDRCRVADADGAARHGERRGKRRGTGSRRLRRGTPSVWSELGGNDSVRNEFESPHVAGRVLTLVGLLAAAPFAAPEASASRTEHPAEAKARRRAPRSAAWTDASPARARASRLSGVSSGASIAMPVRCRRPSRSIASSTSCLRAARATVMRR